MQHHKDRKQYNKFIYTDQLANFSYFSCFLIIFFLFLQMHFDSYSVYKVSVFLLSMY